MTLVKGAVRGGGQPQMGDGEPYRNRLVLKPLSRRRGTEGSNPSPSSGESVANSIWAKAALPTRLPPRLLGALLAGGHVRSPLEVRLNFARAASDEANGASDGGAREGFARGRKGGLREGAAPGGGDPRSHPACEAWSEIKTQAAYEIIRAASQQNVRRANHDHRRPAPCLARPLFSRPPSAGRSRRSGPV
jgi:hypothetical protein